MKTSDPRFPYLQNLLFLLHRVINPQLFFDGEPLPEPERAIEKKRLEDEINDLLLGNSIRCDN